MLYKPQHFSINEFACKCGCDVVRVSAGLVLFLDLLRKACGSPIVVSSGYRCSSHNSAVGGAARSRHMIGCAADIQGVSYSDVCNFAFGLTDVEIREYKTFIHFAVARDCVARLWDGGFFRWL